MAKTTNVGKPSRAQQTPAALAERLGIREWQVDRAHAEGILPARDRSKGWSADLADRIVAEHTGHVTELVDRIGRIPDGGTYETGEYLAAALGAAGRLSGDTVYELARLGAIAVRFRDGHGYPTYSGRSVEAFTRTPDFAAVVAAADVSGRSLTADEAAAALQIRRTDFDHLVRGGFLKPMRIGLTGHVAKSADPGLPLYRGGDVDELAASTDIDWPAVRATPKGHRSPLAKLPDAARGKS